MCKRYQLGEFIFFTEKGFIRNVAHIQNIEKVTCNVNFAFFHMPPMVGEFLTLHLPIQE
jgi:hypothetical protein